MLVPLTLICGSPNHTLRTNLAELSAWQSHALGREEGLCVRQTQTLRPTVRTPLFKEREVHRKGSW